MASQEISGETIATISIGAGLAVLVAGLLWKRKVLVDWLRKLKKKKEVVSVAQAPLSDDANGNVNENDDAMREVEDDQIKYEYSIQLPQKDEIVKNVVSALESAIIGKSFQFKNVKFLEKNLKPENIYESLDKILTPLKAYHSAEQYREILLAIVPDEVRKNVTQRLKTYKYRDNQSRLVYLIKYFFLLRKDDEYLNNNASAVKNFFGKGVDFDMYSYTKSALKSDLLSELGRVGSW